MNKIHQGHLNMCIINKFEQITSRSVLFFFKQRNNKLLSTNNVIYNTLK